MFIEITDFSHINKSYKEVKVLNTDKINQITLCPQQYVAHTTVYLSNGSFVNFHGFSPTDLKNEINKQMEIEKSKNQVI